MGIDMKYSVCYLLISFILAISGCSPKEEPKIGDWYENIKSKERFKIEMIATIDSFRLWSKNTILWEQKEYARCETLSNNWMDSCKLIKEQIEKWEKIKPSLIKKRDPIVNLYKEALAQEHRGLIASQIGKTQNYDEYQKKIESEYQKRNQKTEELANQLSKIDKPIQLKDYHFQKRLSDAQDSVSHYQSLSRVILRMISNMETAQNLLESSGDKTFVIFENESPIPLSKLEADYLKIKK